MQIPKHLSKESKKLWHKMLKAFELDDDQVLLLKVGLENYDLMQQCREEIDVSGILIESPTSRVRHMNPAIQILKIATSNFLQAWRILGVGEPPEQVRGLIMRGK